MSRLDDLPPDLKAVLSLLLRQQRRSTDVAALLGIPERALHDRAHAALALLAPGQARALTAAEREQLGEYLLGQQPPKAAAQTRSYLETSVTGRAWAQALADELAPIAALPPVPGPSDGTPPASSSRVGGAVVLGALVALIVVVVLLVVGIGGGGGGASHTGTQPSAASGGAGNGTSGGSRKTSTGGASGAGGNGTSGANGTTGGTTTTGAQTSHGKALTLTPPDPASSKAVAVAYVLTQKGQRAFYLFAKGLPTPPSGIFYAVWLDGAASAPAYPLGSLPAATASGLVEGGGPLPASAGSYRRILVTSETGHHPTHPGPTVLGGTFSLG